MPRVKTGRKAGRPAGRKNEKTLLKETVLKELTQRVMGNTHLLLDSQTSIARGIQFLYRIDKEWISTGKGSKGGYWKNLKPVLVENVEEIRQYIEDKIEKGDETDEQDPGAAYYFITTKEPNNNAIDSLFDRTFGKSTNNVDITSGGKPIPLLGGARKKENKK